MTLTPEQEARCAQLADRYAIKDRPWLDVVRAIYIEATQQEREACAKVVEMLGDYGAYDAEKLATAIRQRGGG